MLNKLKTRSIVIVFFIIWSVHFIHYFYFIQGFEFIWALTMFLCFGLIANKAFKDRNYQFVILGKDNYTAGQAAGTDIYYSGGNKENEAALETLRRSEEKYRFMFENNLFPMYTFDLEAFNIVEVNNAALEKYGYTREEFLSLNIEQLRSEREKTKVAQLYVEAKKNNISTYKSEAWHIKKDGNLMCIDANVFFIIDNGKMVALALVNDITQKKMAEEALRLSEEKYRNIFENSPFSKFIFELEEYRIIDVNIAAIEIYGYTREEFLELTLDQVRSPKEKNKIKDLAEYVRKNNLTNFRGQSIHVKKDGTEIFVDVNVYFTIDGGIKVGHAQINDITEKKLSEEALMKSEANLKAIIENTKDAIWSLDTEGKVLAVNNTYLKLFYDYYKIDLKPGRYIFELMKQESREFHYAFFQKVLSGEQVFFEWGDNLNGKDIYFEVTINPIITENGKITGASYFMRDVTDSKHTQLSLKNNEEKYRKLIETMNEGLLYVDNDDNVQFTNDRFLEITGYDASEMKGDQPLKLLVDETTRKKILDKSKLRLKGISDDYEVQIIRKNGEKIWVFVSGSPLYNDQNEVIGTIATFIDITERKNTEDKLLAKNRELDEFAYIVSHDLKAPLRAINSLSEWIEEDLGDKLQSETKQNMDLMRSRVKRMEMLINGILEYSRIGRNTTLTEKIEINHFLKDIVEMLSPPRNFNIEIKADTMYIYAERIKLQQVFSNLIGNAVKHHEREDGRVTICATKYDEHCEFSVEDDGPGIDAKFHEKIFAIFQTLKSKDTVESTGIGLTIVKKIIEENGGAIRLESQSGKGAKFIFTWNTQNIGNENDVVANFSTKTSFN